MLFKSRFHEGIIAGRITLTFRSWSRPQAKAGRPQRFGSHDRTREASGYLQIDAVDLVPVSSITDEQAHRAGFDDRASLIHELSMMARRPPRSEAKVYRVAFRYVRAPDERARLASNAELSPEGREALSARLERMDARSDRPWTMQTLALIASNPGVVSTKLAQRLGRERLALKADVRKLKALGLTHSLEVGYELSPRGRAFLRGVASS